MIFHKRPQPTTVVFIGMFLTTAASLSLHYLPRTHWPENVTDGISGLLFGLAIGALGLGATMLRGRNCRREQS